MTITNIILIVTMITIFIIKLTVIIMLFVMIIDITWHEGITATADRIGWVGSFGEAL